MQKQESRVKLTGRVIKMIKKVFGRLLCLGSLPTASNTRTQGKKHDNFYVVLLLAFLLLNSCSDGKSRNKAYDCQARLAGSLPEPIKLADLSSPLWVFEDIAPALSSIRAVDLNGDGILDIIQGHGGTGDVPKNEGHLSAVDGATGELLWRVENRRDLVGTASFVDINQDGTPDVVIGGRDGDLIAVDGKSGVILWSFIDIPDNITEGERWFNFYTVQIISDQNGDGVPDILTATGIKTGETISPDNPRAIGYMLVVSGKTGKFLASAPVPDGAESYMSPLVIPKNKYQEESILFGTGGETHPGSLWRAPLADVMVNDLSQAEILVSSNDKGYIAPPALADLNGDGILDIVVQAVDGTVSAVDGKSHNEIWRVENPGFESQASPTIGYFAGDDLVPDVFISISYGEFDLGYQYSKNAIINGATGKVAWQMGFPNAAFHPSGDLAVDLNGDCRDEIIFSHLYLAVGESQFFLFDTAHQEVHPLGEPFVSTVSSPWIGDIDNNGSLDLVLSEASFANSPFKLFRFELPYKTPRSISWGAYIGTKGDGVLVD